MKVKDASLKYVAVRCEGKIITVTNDGEGVNILFDYDSIETPDVVRMTLEEASLFALTIQQLLGETQALTPIEKVKI